MIIFSATVFFLVFFPSLNMLYGGGGHGTLVDVSQNFWPLIDEFLSQKWAFFRNFRDVSTNNTPKFFYCIFIRGSLFGGGGSTKRGDPDSIKIGSEKPKILKIHGFHGKIGTFLEF